MTAYTSSGLFPNFLFFRTSSIEGKDPKQLAATETAPELSWLAADVKGPQLLYCQYLNY